MKGKGKVEIIDNTETSIQQSTNNLVSSHRVAFCRKRVITQYIFIEVVW